MLDQPAPLAVPPPEKRRKPWIKAFSFLRCIAFAAIVFFAIRYGLKLRAWEYPATEQYRFTSDINNAWRQGWDVIDDAHELDPKSAGVSFGNLMRAYVGRYDKVMAERSNGNYELDYPPARLLIMSVWVWHETDGGKPKPRATTFLGFRIGRPDALGTPAELAGPLLNVNTTFGLLAFAGAFMLARAVLKREQNKWAPFIALGPAILIWFNPAVLIDAHAWPQWDVWILPFWLWAGYFAVTRRWLAAGICLGLGVMFKGQIFLTMPLFVLWPLFQFRLHRLLDCLLGILLGMMLYVWPWTLALTGAKIAFALAMGMTLCVLPWIRRGWRMTVLCGMAGACLLLAGLFLGGSMAWWTVGFEYGTNRYMSMTMGPAPNLAQSLGGTFGWNILDVVYTIDWKRPAIHHDITVQEAMVGLYSLMLVLCAIGAALQDARGDRRVLVAIAAPWVAMFAFLPEMHERYLMWGAALTALLAAVSVGGLLMHLLVTFIACVPIVLNMRGFGGDYPQLAEFVGRANEALPWVTVLVALILIYWSMSGSRKGRRVVVPTVGGVGG